MYSLWYYCVISVRSISDNCIFLMFCNWWLLLCIATWHREWRVGWRPHKPSGTCQLTRTPTPDQPTRSRPALAMSLAHTLLPPHLSCSLSVIPFVLQCVLVSFCCELIVLLCQVNLTLQDHKGSCSWCISQIGTISNSHRVQ